MEKLNLDPGIKAKGSALDDAGDEDAGGGIQDDYDGIKMDTKNQ